MQQLRLSRVARSPLRRSALTSLAALALGCTSDGIDLGGGALTQPLERGARCQDSAIVEGNVRVANQQELEGLEGCQEIRGDFTIRKFSGAELTPLHALQVVAGGFVIRGYSGRYVPDTEQDSQTMEDIRLAEQALESLGVKAMQVVAFELNPSLAEVDFGGLERADRLVILQNPALGQVNLGALAKVDTLQITDNPLLDTSVFDPVRTFERIESGNALRATP